MNIIIIFVKLKNGRGESSCSFEYAIKNLNKSPRYIGKFFEDLMVMDKKLSAKVINNKEHFLELLEEKIVTDINLYFDNEDNSESDDELDF